MPCNTHLVWRYGPLWELRENSVFQRRARELCLREYVEQRCALAKSFNFLSDDLDKLNEMITFRFQDLACYLRSVTKPNVQRDVEA